MAAAISEVNVSNIEHELLKRELEPKGNIATIASFPPFHKPYQSSSAVFWICEEEELFINVVQQ